METTYTYNTIMMRSVSTEKTQNRTNWTEPTLCCSTGRRNTQQNDRASWTGPPWTSGILCSLLPHWLHSSLGKRQTLSYKRHYTLQSPTNTTEDGECRLRRRFSARRTCIPCNEDAQSNWSCPSRSSRNARQTREDAVTASPSRRALACNSWSRTRSRVDPSLKYTTLEWDSSIQ